MTGEQLARQIHDGYQQLVKRDLGHAPMPWEELPLDHRRRLTETCEEIIREAMFPRTLWESAGGELCN